MYCNRTFIFEKCRKYKAKINPTEAPIICKFLKANGLNKALIKI